MNRSQLVISMLAMLLLGAALGVAGSFLYVHQVHGQPGMRIFTRQDRPGAGDAMERLHQLLGLTPEQMQRLEPLVADSRRQFDSARDTLHARIEAELTPAQMATWNRWLASRERPRRGAAAPDTAATH